AELHLGYHPGRPARRVDVEGPPHPVRDTPHRASPARRGEGGPCPDPHHAAHGRLHLPVALHRDPRARRALRDEVLRFVLDRSPGSAQETPSEQVVSSTIRGPLLVRNRTRGSVLATRCDVANNPLTQGLGLIPRGRLPEV